MLLSTEQLKAIEDMASLFFSPSDIADNLQIEDNEEFISMIEIRKGEAYLAYRKGRLKTETELREAIRIAALNGSSPAQNLMVQFYKDSQL